MQVERVRRSVARAAAAANSERASDREAAAAPRVTRRPVDRCARPKGSVGRGCGASVPVRARSIARSFLDLSLRPAWDSAGSLRASKSTAPRSLSLSSFSPHTCRCPPCIRPSCPARPWRRAENESGWRVDERAAEAGGRACFPPLSLSLVSPWACPPALPGPLLHQPRQSRFGRRHRAARGRGRRGVAAGTLPSQP